MTFTRYGHLWRIITHDDTGIIAEMIACPVVRLYTRDAG